MFLFFFVAISLRREYGFNKPIIFQITRDPKGIQVSADWVVRNATRVVSLEIMVYSDLGTKGVDFGYLTKRHLGK